jgi:dTDP-4-dehydrorhamnose 3,5-epimerase
MEIVELEKDGPVIIQPKLFKDERGYFFESFNEKEFEEKVGKVNFVQDNESKSSYGVLRGLHFQKPPYAQAKLVRVVKGAVFDAAVDIRKDSPTYGRWWGAYLSEENHRQFFLPRGFAHGFVALKDDTIFQYKCDNFYNKESEGAIYWNDPDIGINWGSWINIDTDIILSDKDKRNPCLDEIKDNPF